MGPFGPLLSRQKEEESMKSTTEENMSIPMDLVTEYLDAFFFSGYCTRYAFCPSTRLKILVRRFCTIMDPRLFHQPTGGVKLLPVEFCSKSDEEIRHIICGTKHADGQNVDHRAALYGYYVFCSQAHQDTRNLYNSVRSNVLDFMQEVLAQPIDGTIFPETVRKSRQLNYPSAAIGAMYRMSQRDTDRRMDREAWPYIQTELRPLGTNSDYHHLVNVFTETHQGLIREQSERFARLTNSSVQFQIPWQWDEFEESQAHQDRISAAYLWLHEMPDRAKQILTPAVHLISESVASDSIELPNQIKRLIAGSHKAIHQNCQLSQAAAMTPWCDPGQHLMDLPQGLFAPPNLAGERLIYDKDWLKTRTADNVLTTEEKWLSNAIRAFSEPWYGHFSRGQGQKDFMSHVLKEEIDLLVGHQYRKFVEILLEREDGSE